MGWTHKPPRNRPKKTRYHLNSGCFEGFPYLYQLRTQHPFNGCVTVLAMLRLLCLVLAIFLWNRIDKHLINLSLLLVHIIKSKCFLGSTRSSYFLFSASHNTNWSNTQWLPRKLPLQLSFSANDKWAVLKRSFISQGHMELLTLLLTHHLRGHSASLRVVIPVIILLTLPAYADLRISGFCLRAHSYDRSPFLTTWEGVYSIAHPPKQINDRIIGKLKTCGDTIQGGPLPVTSGVITPINRLSNWDSSPYL